MKAKSQNRYRGVVAIYTIVIMTALCMFISLAVDYGRAQLVKTELRRAADASARAAAAYIYSDLNAGTAAAIDIASRNKADGTAVDLVAVQDIQFGNWDVKSKNFTLSSSSSAINAVRVIARRTQARGNAVPMLFARVLRCSFCDVQAETIVMAVQPLNVSQNIPATANPFLSGMPPGSIGSHINPHNNPDFAGTASGPLQMPLVTSMPITDDQILNFDSITGTAQHDPSLDFSNPDGDLSEQIGHNNLTTSHSNNYVPTMYNENGIADAWIPINSLVGIFLDDKVPSTSSAPGNLDFRDPTSRDFNELHPQLKQLFFIGDGLNSKGQHQKFIAPKGATRLFLATMDYYEWNNNSGYRQIKITRPQQIIVVK
jgi:hypothetical protein